MKCIYYILVINIGLLVTIACSRDQHEKHSQNQVNPFLDDFSNYAKSDTAYINPHGIEVEVDIEADIQAAKTKISRAPAELGQFAATYLRKTNQLYLESLAEDITSPGRVEWLIDGEWYSAEHVENFDHSMLTHFRIKGVNAILLSHLVDQAEVSTQFTAKVPIRPYDAFADGGDGCIDKHPYLASSPSVYWYLWNPDQDQCNVDVQDMSLTISAVYPAKEKTYPEYDRLTEDGKLTTVILFGQISDTLDEKDPGNYNLEWMAYLLTSGGYEEFDSEIGRRFVKIVDGFEFIVDLYSPYVFAGLNDRANYGNFERAVTEHEIIVYDGHSLMGLSDFWSRPSYPDQYQIFLYGGCLGYEYYVRPILEGKGGWQQVDIMSSVFEVIAPATDFAAPILARIEKAIISGRYASWNELLQVVRDWVYDSSFGVSGARDNCFTPSGSRCTE